MLFTLYEILCWLQPEATGGGGAMDGGGGDPAGDGTGCASQAGLLIVMMLVFYFLLIRPQQKRQKDHDALLKSIRKGAVVRTTGGIRGEVFAIDDREVVLLISDKVKINVLRSHVAGLEKTDEDQGDKDKDQDKG